MDLWRRKYPLYTFFVPEKPANPQMEEISAGFRTDRGILVSSDASFDTFCGWVAAAFCRRSKFQRNRTVLQPSFYCPYFSGFCTTRTSGNGLYRASFGTGAPAGIWALEKCCDVSSMAISSFHHGHI